LAPYRGIDFAHVNDKDASVFPIAIANHAGKMQLAMLHRPVFPGTLPEDTLCRDRPREVDAVHESIWISYCPMPLQGVESQQLALFNSHHRLACPVASWENLKIGAGTPPILTEHGLAAFLALRRRLELLRL
jgi:beta-1,2-mannobiose phosphorylase / 1,2-beta-oligomannan phosphorylase